MSAGLCHEDATHLAVKMFYDRSYLLLDCSHRLARARSSRDVRQLDSVFRRFSRWSHKGVWQRIFEAMSEDTDFEYLIVDSTIIRAHQHAAGAKKGV